MDAMEEDAARSQGGTSEVLARLDLGEGSLVLTRDRVVLEDAGPLRSGTHVVPVRSITGVSSGEEGSAWLLTGGALVGVLFIVGLIGVPYATVSTSLAIAANALTGLVMFAFFAAFFLVKETWVAVDAPGARVRASKHGLEGASVEPFMEAVLSAVAGADRAS